MHLKFLLALKPQRAARGAALRGEHPPAPPAGSTCVWAGAGACVHALVRARVHICMCLGTARLCVQVRGHTAGRAVCPRMCVLWICVHALAGGCVYKRKSISACADVHICVCMGTCTGLCVYARVCRHGGMCVHVGCRDVPVHPPSQLGYLVVAPGSAPLPQPCQTSQGATP